jgi:malate dehydrogenase (oxaloacetate-decarboxylating)(NADP+)
MAERPIIFAMANPDPEITPEEVARIRDDAIMATGRSDYPNQVNNVLGFPYIFRGALDVRATTINDDMKIAAVKALASLAREDVPDDVAAAYQGNRPRFGAQYIIPVPFDPRLISAIPVAVAQAAIDSGVARKVIADMAGYARELSARRDPIASTLASLYERVRRRPKRVVFAEAEEEQVMRAALSYANQQLGTAILLGREDLIHATAERAGIDLNRPGLEIVNARISTRVETYIDYLYARLQRKGYLHRDAQRLIHNDRNHFAACMVALGDADGMVTGITRNYSTALDDVRRCIDDEARPPRHRRLDRALPRPHRLRRRYRRPRHAVRRGTRRYRRRSRRLSRVAWAISRASPCSPIPPSAIPRANARSACARRSSILDKRHVDFEYDGEMAADVALNRKVMEQYPFCRLSGPANVLVMPAFHSASISTKMLQELGGSTVIGPILVGVDKAVQITSMGAKDSDIVNMAAIAAYTAGS